MLDKIKDVLLPPRLKEADAREARTTAVAKSSKTVRRSAEAQMIASYRAMGEAVERHGWRD